MNQTAFQALAISLVQKLLIGGGTALMTYLGTQGNVEGAAAALAPIIVGAAWGFWNKWQAHKVAVAATNAGVDVKAVKSAPVQAAQ